MFVKPISGFPDIPFSFELRLRKGGLSQRYRTLGPESVVVFLSLREHCVEGENRAPGHKEERPRGRVLWLGSLCPQASAVSVDGFG